MMLTLDRRFRHAVVIGWGWLRGGGLFWLGTAGWGGIRQKRKTSKTGLAKSPEQV
jgi:hypothetical protein